MPNGVALEGPPVRVSVRILADGAVADLRVKRSSGDPAFDEACLEAVRAAAPLKPPPEAVRRTYARGVLLEFERRDLAR
jgi:TonB family protein